MHRHTGPSGAPAAVGGLTSVPTGSDAPGAAPPLRRDVLEQLFGDERLVVIHGGRFSATTDLLRSWAAEIPRAFHTSKSHGVPPVVAGVLDPPESLREEEYWSRLDFSLRAARPRDEGRPNLTPLTSGYGRPGGLTRSGESDAEAAQAAFDSLCTTLTGLATPVALALDDLHLIPDAVSRVAVLLEHAPSSGIRIVASTRVADRWYEAIARVEGRKLLTPSDLLIGTHETEGFLRQWGLGLDVRAPRSSRT